jgi:hypothetical protein
MSTTSRVSPFTAHPVLNPNERQRCEVWTRVMGYHRPVASFNIGKQGEFFERKYFAEPVSQAPRREANQS